MESRAALISVSDKTGLLELAKELSLLGFTLLATKGSKTFLDEQGLKAESIEQYTGQVEILDGRVKTLHPKIYAGLLARRDNPQHLKELTDHGILKIDLAIVNLYPFLQNLASDNATAPEKMVEFVDIGGPCMMRAAAKNHASVCSVCDPTDYPELIEYLKSDFDKPAGLNFRRKLAVKVFSTLANYDLQIARYFSAALSGEESAELESELLAGEISGLVLNKQQALRYGENPHQRAAFFKTNRTTELPWEQLGGKELSYNNFLDFDAAVKLVSSLETVQSAAVIIKHLNPCGVAQADSVVQAIRSAKLGDPRSHFGGIVAVNCILDGAAAAEITADFAEIIAATEFSPEALEILRNKKNLRIIRYQSGFSNKYELRSAAGGYLVQESDRAVSSLHEAQLMTTHRASAEQLQDLQLAWQICSQVKSNAIVLVKEGVLQAVGAGQMSRIDSVELAISKAKTHQHDLSGAVAASDAFFPFSDSITTLAAAGVTAVVVTKGSLKDAESVKAAEELGIALYFVADRHFRH